MRLVKRALGWVMAGLFVLGAAWLSAPAQAQPAAACAGRAAPAPGLTEHTFEHDGVTRSYLLYAPASLDSTQPAPVVFSLHGFASNARHQVLLTGWNDVADEHGFLVVYPQGLGALPRWDAGLPAMPAADGTGDTGFLTALAASLSETLCVDPARIYVNGLSNGGGMTYRLACDASDVFAAFGGVAGAYSGRALCEPSRPIPMLFFHGTADLIVPFDGGNGMPAIAPFVEALARHNGCDPQPAPIASVGSVSGWQYLHCEADASVALYIIDGGGHTWPGGWDGRDFLLGTTTQEVSASAILWDFYEAHPLVGG